MKTSKITFLDFVGQPETQFVVPVFQRVYSWEAKECGDFWDDILKAGERDKSYFMGVLLYIVDAEAYGGNIRLNIVDGQQRLTTFSILLAAVQRYLRNHNLTVGGMDADTIVARFLLAVEDEQLQPKLILTYLDRFTLYEVIAGAEPSEEHSQRIIDNFDYFYNKMEAEGFNLEALWRGIEKLYILNVMLTGEDSPQFVFESLNSKGLSLTTGDLLRSRILLFDTEHPGAGLYEKYWIPIEAIGEEHARSLDGASTIAEAWVASKCREKALIHDASEIYPFLKDTLREKYDNSLEDMLVDVMEFAQQFSDDAEFRESHLKDREEWIKGRLKGSISSLKLFGD